MQETLSYRHRTITDDDLIFIRKLITENPGSSRWKLSRKLCEAWNWVQANGAMRDMVCRSMMLMLHRRGLIELPAVRRVQRNPLVDRKQIVCVDVEQTALQTSFAELGAVELHQVRRTPEEALFNSLVQLDGAEFGKACPQRGLLNVHANNLFAINHRVALYPAHLWQLDQAAPMQHEHHGAAHHVAHGAVGLYPVPGLT